MSSLLIKLFIKKPNDTDNPKVREAYGTLGSLIGIICNFLLSVLKIAVGFITGSISISADGFNNLSDMSTSIITMLGFKMAGKPADSDHPFGHGRLEYMSAFVVAVIILLVGFELLKTSISTLIKGSALPQYSLISFIILIASVLIKFWLYFFNRKIGKKISSEALLASSKDSLNDTIATLVIIASIIISKVFTLPFNLDAVLGIFVAIFILYSGVSSAKQTIDQILGTPPKKELILEIEETILSFEGFLGIHDLIVHNYGPGRQFASVHVEVPQSCDIVKCHEQIDLCEKLLFERLNVSVVIHMDPIDNDSEIVTQTKQDLSEKLREIHNDLTLHDFRMTPVSQKRTNLIFDVVIPQEFKMNIDTLREKIELSAKEINPSFMCVITFDNDFISKK